MMLSSKISNEKGSAIMEFAISIPFLLALLIGLIATGNQLANLIYLNQVVYNSVLKGTQLESASRESGMRDRASKMLALGNHKLEDLFLTNDPHAMTATEPSDRTVGMDLNAPLKQVLFTDRSDGRISQALNAPLLLPRARVSGDMTSFQNPVSVTNDDDIDPPTPTDDDDNPILRGP